MHATKRIEPQLQEPLQEPKSALEEIVREGARRMLQDAIENEVNEYLEIHKEAVGESGHRLIVGNGFLPERSLVTGVGPLTIRQPRVRDRREGQRFTSQILPPYMRRAPSVDALIPALYLKGVSTGDFSEALESILGPQASGLSATNVVRLKKGWEEDYRQWNSRDLSQRHYVYLWADGIYFNVRLEDKRICCLVIMGALPCGKKELVAVCDGFRESKISWLEVLRSLKKRGLTQSPMVAVGDGALGFWSALSEVFPDTRHQRCWVHKTANILDKMAKKIQSHAKGMIHEMYMAPTKNADHEAYETFIETYVAKYHKACERLAKDKGSLFTFYDFPAEHWAHIRTTKPIESTFATVRLRTKRTKGCGSTMATLTMVFKLALEAEKRWRRLNASRRIAQVVEGVRFIDGVAKGEKAA